MKPPLNILWLLLHAAAASTEKLFLLVTEPRSGSDWLVDLLDAHPNVCVPAGRWAEKGSGDKHNGIDGHALVGVAKAKTLNASGADVGAAYEAAADAPAPEPAAIADADMEPCRVDATTVEIPAQALEEPGDPRPSPKRARVDEAPAAADPEPAAAPAPELDAATVKKMTVAKLRAALTERGLDTKGLKAALQARLLAEIA